MKASFSKSFVEEVMGRADVSIGRYSNLPPDLFYRHKRHYKSHPSAGDLLPTAMSMSPNRHIRVRRSYVRHSFERRHLSSLLERCDALYGDQASLPALRNQSFTHRSYDKENAQVRRTKFLRLLNTPVRVKAKLVETKPRSILQDSKRSNIRL